MATIKTTKRTVIDDYEDIIKDLKNKKYYPIYFLMGEEDYFIDEIVDYISKNILEENVRDFNQTTIYGSDTSLEKIIMSARQYPMMGKQQVIIVREAQLIKGFDNDSENEKKEGNAWLNYVQNPIATTILVIAYKSKKLDKRKKIYKALEGNSIVFDSTLLRDYEMPAWLSSYIKSQGYDIQSAAIQILIAHLGTNLTKAANEIAKLTSILPQGTLINSQHIEDNIGISKDFNVFELNKAIGSKDNTKALTIIAHFAKNQKDNPIQQVIPMLFAYFLKILLTHTSYKNCDNQTLAKVLKINEFFVGEHRTAAQNYPKEKVERIISYLRHYDAYSKGVNNIESDGGELLKELITLIMN